MDVVFTKKAHIWSRYFATLIVILILQILQTGIATLFFDTSINKWLWPFDSVLLRFLIREVVVYTVVVTGYIQLLRMNSVSFIPSLYIVGSVFIDGVFVLIGASRLLFNFEILNSKYLEFFNYINSGIYFTFCFALNLIFQDVNPSDSIGQSNGHIQ